jgi:hypothetical protein
METLNSEITTTMDDNLRINVTISPYILRKLKLWAMLHGKTPSAYAGQIVSARVEANINAINQMAEEYAAFKGMSLEELEKQTDQDN